MNTLSVALIVKNEEQTLGRCLESLAGAVDEIVVVDTGSSDATKAVARRYTDRVFDFAWCHDFAAARQVAFDRTRGDWVFWVDADDVVLHADRIRVLVDEAPRETGAIYWRYVADRDQWGNSRCEFWRERCVPNDGSFHWVGKVHEVLVTQQPRQTLRSPHVVVEHHSDPGRVAGKARRNLDILEADVAAAGDAPAARSLYYLAREYVSAGEPDRALATFERYLGVATWADERYLAQLQVADLQRGRQRYEPALDAALAALKICPHWPDAYFNLARTYYFLQDWHKVIHWTDVGRAMPRPATDQIIDPLDYRFNWMIYYTNALYHVGAQTEAMTWTQRALQICPDDPWHRENFLRFSGVGTNGT